MTASKVARELQVENEEARKLLAAAAIILSHVADCEELSGQIRAAALETLEAIGAWTKHERPKKWRFL